MCNTVRFDVCPLLLEDEDFVLKKRTDAPDGSDGSALVRLDHGTLPGTHAANVEHRRSKWTALVLAHRLRTV